MRLRVWKQHVQAFGGVRGQRLTSGRRLRARGSGACSVCSGLALWCCAPHQCPSCHAPTPCGVRRIRCVAPSNSASILLQSLLLAHPENLDLSGKGVCLLTGSNFHSTAFLGTVFRNLMLRLQVLLQTIFPPLCNITLSVSRFRCVWRQPSVSWRPCTGRHRFWLITSQALICVHLSRTTMVFYVSTSVLLRLWCLFDLQGLLSSSPPPTKMSVRRGGGARTKLCAGFGVVHVLLFNPKVVVWGLGVGV